MRNTRKAKYQLDTILKSLGAECPEKRLTPIQVENLTWLKWHIRKQRTYTVRVITPLCRVTRRDLRKGNLTVYENSILKIVVSVCHG